MLTDIRMPKLDGLEMARIVREELPKGKVILLTGYTDFQYAKEAVCLGVFDFVTKPFSLNQIEAAVVMAVEAVLEDRRQMERLRSLERKASEGIGLRRRQFLQRLVRHTSDKAAIERDWTALEIGLLPERLVVALLEIDRLGEDENGLCPPRRTS